MKACHWRLMSGGVISVIKKSPHIHTSRDRDEYLISVANTFRTPSYFSCFPVERSGYRRVGSVVRPIDQYLVFDIRDFASHIGNLGQGPVSISIHQIQLNDNHLAIFTRLNELELNPQFLLK
jgi:hypothetical protein